MTSVARLAACLVTLLAVMPVPAPAARTSPERSLIRQINHYRAANGQPPLRPSRALARGARSYSASLMRTDRFGHAASIRAPGRWRSLGEVLAFHPGLPRGGGWAMRAWRGSAGHASVLLGGGFRSVGVGRARGRFGGRRATIWAVQVGRR